MVSVADRFKGNNNFEYDLVDIVRQALAEKGRLMQKAVTAAYRAGDKQLFALASGKFLDLILLQDKLLGTRPEFRVGKWIEEARALGDTRNCTNGMPVYRLRPGVTGTRPITVVSETMLTKSGTAC